MAAAVSLAISRRNFSRCNLLISKFNLLHWTSSVSRNSSISSTMSAWQIHQYGGIEQVTLSKSTRVPIIRRPSDVLIDVHAASINPIDIRMLSGYASNMVNTFRKLNSTLQNASEFPLTLGRDFSGTVAAVGKDVHKYAIGDEVWGTVRLSNQGSHAQYVLVPSTDISRKPESLSHVEAGSLPYVASTTWSAINTIGHFNEKNLSKKRVLVLGGSGGLGTFAIQLLKAWGADITTTCASDCIEKSLELGADIAIDYTKADGDNDLEQVKGFDLIFDTVGQKVDADVIRLLRPSRHAMYVTVVMPLMPNTDRHGVLLGVTQSAVQLAASAAKALRYGVHVRWAIYLPNANALDTVAKLVDRKQIVPIIEKVVPFHDLPDAMKKVAAKHNRGKTVVDFKGSA